MKVDAFPQNPIESSKLTSPEAASIGADRHSHVSILTDLSEKSLYFLSVECLYSGNPEPTLPTL
jgi:hypothetical protein